MKYKDYLKYWQDIASEKGYEESAILLLLLYEAKLTSSELYMKMDDEIDKKISDNFETDVKKYLDDNIPVQYIIGEACFYGYDFNVNKDVLIPRPETEELVENILFLYDDYFKGKDIDVVDIGTGSGCISVTLAAEEPHMHLKATDISGRALNVARSNAKKMNVNIDFKEGNMLEPVMNDKFDILVSNPPYIPTEDLYSLQKEVLHEPKMALDGGDDGLKFYRAIVKNWVRFLKKTGCICVEIGINQSNEVVDIFKHANFKNIQTIKDLSGIDRVVAAKNF